MLGAFTWGSPDSFDLFDRLAAQLPGDTQTALLAAGAAG